MKLAHIPLAVLLLVGARAFAQVPLTVEIITDKDQFLPGESLRIGVRIANTSGRTLTFGTNRTWLRLAVESREGVPVPLLYELPIDDVAFTVESSSRVTRRVEIAPYYNLTKPGGYNISATLFISEWSAELKSNVKRLDIISPTKIWGVTVGVPPTPGQTGLPELRKYALQQAMHMKEMQLYVRVTDEKENRIFAVFPVGTLLSFSTPEAKVDKISRLHVLHQTGAKTFSYSIVGTDGNLITRLTYEYTATRPTLKLDSDQNVIVSGGARRLAADDKTPAPPAADTNAVPVQAVPHAEANITNPPAPATATEPPKPAAPADAK